MPPGVWRRSDGEVRQKSVRPELVEGLLSASEPIACGIRGFDKLSPNGCCVITADRTAFREALPMAGRLIGLDVGTKTIGTALCDAEWSFASPALLIRRTKFQKDKAALAELIAAQSVKGIVIGLPLNLDGSESPRSQSTRAFARNLEDLGLPILLQDERWSTQAVTRQMIAEDVTRAKRAERVDKLAASYILQGAIDGLVRD